MKFRSGDGIPLPLGHTQETEALLLIGTSLSKYSEVKKIVAFGSRIRGDFHGDSDLDILIVLERIMSKDQIIHELHEIELDLDVSLAPVILTEAEYRKNRDLGSSFISNVEREGLILYEIDSGRQS